MVERYDSNIHASFKRSIHICINAHSAPFTIYIQVPLCVILKDRHSKMKLTELIPFLKDKSKWDNLLTKFNIDKESEEILIYATEHLDIESEVILIELEKTDDKLETTINGVRHIQILPSSLAKDLIENDFSQMTGDFEIAKRLLEYCINDA
jgi:hypothetical protein